MNGRTAQDNRKPANGGENANGHNGHAPQPSTDIAASSEWQSGQQIAELRVDQQTEAPHSQWLSEVRDRPRVQNGTALRQFNTPVRVDEIAVAAMTLAEDLQAATQNMPESVELRRFRRDLDQAATTFRDLASKLEVTAGKLVRLAANEGQACGVGWGVCPEHGLTLMNVGDTVTCHVLGCGLENEGEVERCEHPVAYRVVDAAGPALLTCSGHAIACRLYFDNPVITATSDSMELF
ncbi:hypothetical protein [Kribbella sp. NPDC004875]|uniref:hypothetical protein n=1 Tax=Kribbella sp. NPDC004875 TaxID=3364107 RepID=UPI00369DF94C